MKEVASATAVQDGGLQGDIAVAARRGITFLASGHWGQVTSELGVPLAWHTRRANVLVDAPRIGHLIGRIVRVGDAEVEILGETKPCDLMDALHPGLKNALVADCRAGVHGRVLSGGEFKVGDTLVVTA